MSNPPPPPAPDLSAPPPHALETGAALDAQAEAPDGRRSEYQRRRDEWFEGLTPAQQAEFRRWQATQAAEQLARRHRQARARAFSGRVAWPSLLAGTACLASVAPLPVLAAVLLVAAALAAAVRAAARTRPRPERRATPLYRALGRPLLMVPVTAGWLGVDLVVSLLWTVLGAAVVLAVAAVPLVVWLALDGVDSLAELSGSEAVYSALTWDLRLGLAASAAVCLHVLPRRLKTDRYATLAEAAARRLHGNVLLAGLAAALGVAALLLAARATWGRSLSWWPAGLSLRELVLSLR